MKKVLIFILLISSFAVQAQNRSGNRIKAKKELIANDEFTWQGHAVQKDSLVYSELKGDSIRFHLIDGNWSDWLLKPVNSDWSSVSGITRILNKPTLYNSGDFNSDFASKTLDNVNEGSTNKHFTTTDKSKLDGLDPSGGGASVLDLVGYQEGGWSAAISSSAVEGWGICFVPSEVDGSSSARNGEGGRYLDQASDGTVGDEIFIDYSFSMYLEYLPTLAVKFGEESQSDTELKIGICNPSDAPYQTYHDQIVLHGVGSGNYQFVTSENPGSNIQITDTGVSRSGETMIFILDVVSETQVDFYLYDINYTLLASATHTTGITTGYIGSITSYCEDLGGSTANGIRQYFGKLILKR